MFSKRESSARQGSLVKMPGRCDIPTPRTIVYLELHLSYAYIVKHIMVTVLSHDKRLHKRPPYTLFYLSSLGLLKTKSSRQGRYF